MRFFSGCVKSPSSTLSSSSSPSSSSPLSTAFGGCADGVEVLAPEENDIDEELVAEDEEVEVVEEEEVEEE